MRELVLTVPATAVEEILDRVLPLVPDGVREEHDGDRTRLRLRGHELPSREQIARAAGPLAGGIEEHVIPDDWRERRLADYRQEVIGDRLVVRPEWAPAAPAGLLDVALSDDLAFGSGNHPTTRVILALLLNMRPLGSFADLGCGSGVLAIVAAKLGWSPVHAVDLSAGSVASARANGARNGVELDVAQRDLLHQPPPPADGFVANILAPVQAVLARRPQLERARWGVLSGFGPAHEPELIPAYAQAGLSVAMRLEVHDWSVIVVTRDG